MSVFNKEEFSEGIPSQLSLFGLPPTNTMVSSIYFQEIRPLSQLSNDGPIEFRVSGQNSLEFLYLAGSQLYIKLKVTQKQWTKTHFKRQSWSCKPVFTGFVFHNRGDTSKQSDFNVQL